jgi:hypothetical protein
VGRWTYSGRIACAAVDVDECGTSSCLVEQTSQQYRPYAEIYGATYGEGVAKFLFVHIIQVTDDKFPPPASVSDCRGSFVGNPVDPTEIPPPLAGRSGLSFKLPLSTTRLNQAIGKANLMGWANGQFSSSTVTGNANLKLCSKTCP